MNAVYNNVNLDEFNAPPCDISESAQQAAYYGDGLAPHNAPFETEMYALAHSAAPLCTPYNSRAFSPDRIRFTNLSITPTQGQGSVIARRSSVKREQPLITAAASDRGLRHTPPPAGNVTPQNLRDNPERLAKVKTEMCQFFEEGGAKNCPYGKSCE